VMGYCEPTLDQTEDIVMPGDRCLGSTGSGQISRHRCPVCGFPGLESNPDSPNPLEFYGGFEICRCCGTEFGADVYVGVPGGTAKRIERLRRIWVGKGATWFSRYYCPPPGWEWKENLRAIGVDPEKC